MKNSSPRQMAILISLISAFVAGFTQLILYYFDARNFFPPWLLSVMFIFIAIYIIVYFLLNSFIFEKINPIYKTILNKNIPEKDVRKGLEEKDVIDEVNKEVLSWANKKTMEIAQLKQMAKYRKEFVGNVSHELKTPIFNIQGYVLTLLDGGIEDSTINIEYLKKSKKNIDRMISIVEDLEQITKLEAGELELNKEKFNMVELIEDVFDSEEMSAKEKGIQLQFNSSYDKPVWVYADRKQIYQVVTNLVVNSINYGKDYGITTASFSDMDKNILVEISDDGPGIPEKDIPRIFERFYRVDKSRSRNAGGTGLGLAIVKHIIEAHKQTINVRSSLNEGTSFVFTLSKAQKL